jgi:hypothetical protein
MNLPLLSQNVGSSGFQSEIQVAFSLIRDFLSSQASVRALGRAPGWAVAKSDDWLSGTASMASPSIIQASCQSAARRKFEFLQWIDLPCPIFLQGGFAFKICDSLIYCATHKK